MFNKYIMRFRCSCCGYPTLDEKSKYEICIICNWEDDSQGDADADEVLGGPNGEYSLTQARNNFRIYFTMYHPDKDVRITAGDTEEEILIKKELMQTYDIFLEDINSTEVKILFNKIKRYENRLHKITREKIKEYEKGIKVK